MKKRFAVLMLAALLTTGAQAAPVPLGTVVKAPDWTAGSEWHYSDGYAVKINSVSAKGAMFERLDAPGQWFMRQGFIKTDSTSGTATRNAIYRTVPDTAGLSLSAGKPLTFQREYLSNGKLLVHASSWTVEGRETITVPAGSFDCWVIVWRTRSMKSDWTGFERWWYSPQAQNYVRMEYKYGPDEDGSRVLMTYNLAGVQPAPVAAPVMPVAPQAAPLPIPSTIPAPVAPPKPAPAVVVTAPVKEAPVAQRDAVSEPAANKDSAVALMLAPGKPGAAKPIKAAYLTARTIQSSVGSGDVAAAAPVLREDQLRAPDDTSAVALMLAPGKAGPAKPIEVAFLTAPSIQPFTGGDIAAAAPALREDQLRAYDDISAVALMLAPGKRAALPIKVATLTAPSVQPSFKETLVAAIAPVLAEDRLRVPAEQPATSQLVDLAKVEITSAKGVAIAAQASVKDEPRPVEMLFASGAASANPEPAKVANAKPAKPAALPKGDKSGPWHAQLGASLDAANVRTSLKKILARNPGAHELPNGVTVREVEGRTFYRAWLGSYDTAPEARSLCDALNIKKVRISGCTVFKGPTTMEARAN